MTTVFSIVIITALVIAGFALVLVILERFNRESSYRTIRNQWGKLSDREYSYEELASISHYFQRYKGDQVTVDDITWNDLDMDRIFMMLNRTYSSTGEEYLYHILRTPLTNNDGLKERDRLIEYFAEHREEREFLQYQFYKAGKTKGISIVDYIYEMHDLKLESSFRHVLSAAGMILSIALAFFMPALGILAIVVFLVHNLRWYFKLKAKLEPYFISVAYIIKILDSANNMKRIKDEELQSYIREITESRKKFAKFLRHSYLVTSAKQKAGSPEEIVLDYVRMLFHVDLIKFNTMAKELKLHIGALEKIMENLGILESCIAVASFREYLTLQCKPELVNEKKAFIKAMDIYHPLIPDPVANSINSDKGVLVTGSNASGKSTFLKTAAINSILAQTIYTCTASSYHACFYQIYSSMALQDNLMEQESYFIVEIKSLKRILNHVGEELPILCFVDEVLRGTNTVERISASAQILMSLAKPDILCFAATHDIELTYLLEKYYNNYHFQEEVEENDILFNYQIYNGRAVSRNAIKLLGIIGYDDEIIQRAEATAARFVESGEWSL